MQQCGFRCVSNNRCYRLSGRVSILFLWIFLIVILVAFLTVGISAHFLTPTRPIKLFSNRMNATDQFNECLWPLPTFELPCFLEALNRFWNDSIKMFPKRLINQSRAAQMLSFEKQYLLYIQRAPLRWYCAIVADITFKAPIENTAWMCFLMPIFRPILGLVPLKRLSM